MVVAQDRVDPIPERLRRCGYCRFWLWPGDTRGRARCMSHPPAAVDGSVWASTDYGDWCGEWELSDDATNRAKHDGHPS